MIRVFNKAVLMRRVAVSSEIRPFPVRDRRARRWIRPVKIILGVFGVTALTFGAISTLAAHWLTMPQRHPLAAGKTPGDLGVEFEEIRFPAHRDGLEVAGWFIPFKGSRRVIVLVHGKDANRTRELDRELGDDNPGEFPDLAVGLSRRGFSVLMIDLRGHGKSGRARFGFGRTERLDVLGAVDWLVARGFRPGRIGVLGISMGAATCIGAASEDDRIGALVADSSFAELTPLVDMHWSSQTRLPALFLPPTKWLGKHWFGCDIDAARPIVEIGSIRKPILLIHCDADPIIPAQHARRLKQAADGSAELWESDSAKHAGAYFVDGEAYLDKVSEFFDRHLNC
jgi:dipeptidyl aminopeptidase/acylaminoacyl peptidase